MNIRIHKSMGFVTIIMSTYYWIGYVVGKSSLNDLWKKTRERYHEPSVPVAHVHKTFDLHIKQSELTMKIRGPQGVINCVTCWQPTVIRPSFVLCRGSDDVETLMAIVIHVDSSTETRVIACWFSWAKHSYWTDASRTALRTLSLCSEVRRHIHGLVMWRKHH